MVRQLVTAEEVHGKTGLNGPELPEPTMPLQQQHAVDFIIETLMREESGSVTLCPLGPLTNIALALVREPKIAPRIREIVLMGGGFFEGGNITPAAEFNIYVDPHAADIVLKSGIPTVMVPLDCTHKALTTAKRVEAFRRLGTRPGIAVAEMLEFFELFDEQQVRHRRRPTARPMRHRLSAEAGTLHRPHYQCLGRDRVGADDGHDGRRLVGRHQAGKERHLSARRRP